MVLHLQALAATLAMIFSLILWIQGLFGAKAVFILSCLWVSYIAYSWLSDTLMQLDRTKRQGLLLGAFGIVMFILSYAMVPLYHILCHGSASLSGEGGVHHVAVNIMTAGYRSLPVKIKSSKKTLSLPSFGHEIVYFDIENQSGNDLDLKLVVASNPRTLKPYFGLVTPDTIHLSPWQKTKFPVEIKFEANIPDDLWNSALLFLFQDINGIGELGKGNAWEKMHGKGYKDGVV